MSNREQAAEYAEKAAKLAAESETRGSNRERIAMSAAAYGTLALFYQREADRANES